MTAPVRPPQVWATASWRAEAVDWIHERLAAAGESVTGPVSEPRLMPWSATMRVPTSTGTVWFKANGSGTAYEPRLLSSLRDWASSRWTTDVVAVDDRRAWSLTLDGGEPLKHRLAVDGDLRWWEGALAEHAELQRALMPHADELLALGVPDLRPSVQPGRLGEVLARPDELLPGLPGGLTTAQYSALRGLAAEHNRWCAELTAGGIAPSLQHDDLHDDNVLLGRSGEYRFFDWGDASVSHPFGVLVGVLDNVGRDRRFTSAQVGRLRDVYLEPWTAEYDRAHLVAVCDLALRVARTGRVLNWHRLLTPLRPAERVEYAEALADWLAESLAPPSP